MIIEQFQSFNSISYIMLNPFTSYVGLDFILTKQMKANSGN